MRFLSFEGLDGSGKSTLIEGLRAELERRRIKVRVTREPGGTLLAEEIRNLILRPEGAEAPVAATEVLLYQASRAQHVAKVIAPSLALGEWVLCDRFSESTVAFQCFARGIDRSDVDRLNRFAEQGLRPELVVYLDLSVEASRARQNRRAEKDAARSLDRIEKEADDFHERVREGFLAQVKEEPLRWFVLDADLSPSDLLSKTVDELSRRGWFEGLGS